MCLLPCPPRRRYAKVRALRGKVTELEMQLRQGGFNQYAGVQQKQLSLHKEELADASFKVIDLNETYMASPDARAKLAAGWLKARTEALAKRGVFANGCGVGASLPNT